MIDNEELEYKMRFFMAVCMAVMSLMMVLCLICLLIKTYRQTDFDYELSYTCSISSITDDSQDRFVLEKEQYTLLGDYYGFYTVSGDGSENRIEISVKRTIIYRTLNDDDTPYLECLENDAGDKWYKIYLPEDAVIR